MQNKKQQGFTLLETVVAVLILTIGVFSLYGLQVASMRGGHIASAATQASNLDARQVETLLTGKYSALEAKDTNGKKCNFFNDHGNGKKPDLDEVELCLSKGDRWLTRNEAQIADEQPDPNYCINYNVAAHYPLRGTKTVRVHVFTVYRSRTSGEAIGPTNSCRAADTKESGLKPIAYELIIRNPDLMAKSKKDE